MIIMLIRIKDNQIIKIIDDLTIKNIIDKIEVIKIYVDVKTTANGANN